MIKILRKTKETDIEIKLNLNGTGIYNIDTGIAFFDHMLEAFSKHAQIDLDINCIGDTDIDNHHTVEDIGIVLGEAFNKSLYPSKNIERFGNATIVMDETSISCDIDISNRPFLVFELPIGGKVGEFEVELIEEFFKAFTMESRITLHLIYNRGKNKHHITEASFKALGVALRRATQANDKAGIASTKGRI